MRITSVLLIFVFLSGCEHLGSTSDAPRKLASHIASTDNIVVTSALAKIDQEHRDMKFIIKGASVRKIVHAVSCAEPWPKDEVGAGDIPNWVLDFYRGTNHLDTISFDSIFIYYEGQKYVDSDTNVLPALDDVLTKLATPKENR